MLDRVWLGVRSCVARRHKRLRRSDGPEWDIGRPPARGNPERRRPAPTLHSRTVPLLHCRLRPRLQHRVIVPKLEEYCDALGRQRPAPMLQAAALLMQHGYFFAAIKVRWRG